MSGKWDWVDLIPSLLTTFQTVRAQEVLADWVNMGSRSWYFEKVIKPGLQGLAEDPDALMKIMKLQPLRSVQRCGELLRWGYSCRAGPANTRVK